MHSGGPENCTYDIPFDRASFSFSPSPSALVTMSSASATTSKRPRAATVGSGGNSAAKRNRLNDSDGSDGDDDAGDVEVDAQSEEGNRVTDDEAPADPVQAVAKRARSAGRARPTAAQKRARFLEKYSGKTPEEVLGE